MFKKRKPEPQAAVPAERVNAIAASIPPIDYREAGSRGARAKRLPAFKQALVKTIGGDEVPVVIKNISATGLRVEYFQSRPLGDEGERVLIVEPSLPLRAWAQLVWQGDGAGGLQIDLEEND